MKSARRVFDHLESRGVTAALIGGAALGAHGVARATLDTDILVADSATLEAAFWDGLEDLGPIEIRRGDADDPLVGVVRFASLQDPLDVIIGPPPWTSRILSRRIRLEIGDASLPLVDRPDLVLLKLYAGGPQDLLDVRLLLAADAGDLRRQVEERLSDSPPAVRASWEALSAANS
jgi:hypothetical protein